MCLRRGRVLSGSVDDATGLWDAIIGMEECRDSILCTISLARKRSYVREFNLECR